ncbi:TfoX/Sxy family DNA transformation protein [Vibrio vulnificus]|uniref:DNA transformation protein n=1 Tax=Vibrio vulnificus TaxID=672 RepID=A0A2S3R1F5_VIBVL|nr:TfoX/Sxy family DNA transformation protein [Vibrio vulnificus]POB46941.1 DNA transformation protein [Vibrio vulnificus]
MITVTLKNSLRLFEELGRITARSLTGGYGIYCDGINFALVVGDVLYIRATSQTIDYFISMEFKPYNHQQGETSNDALYFALPEILWEDTREILTIGAVALRHVKIEQKSKCAESAKNSARIKDLPNLTITSERMLNKAGIDSVAQLQEIGAATAFNEVQKVHSTMIGQDFLWSLEGAIEGKHWSHVPKQRQKELIHQVSRFN